MYHATLVRILADGKFYSGATLGARLGISRTAVWNHIQALARYQLDIHAVRGKGYRLASPIELLDRRIILDRLEDLSCAISPELDVLFDVDSTNRYLLEKSKVMTSGHAVCLAEYQYSGRGRWGRTWVSPFGSNLYCSLLWRSSLALSALSCLGLVVGVAVARALSEIGLTDHRLKWPNDLIWQGKKLAGILIEATGEVSGPVSVVIGVGVNVNMSMSAARDIDQPWVNLSEAVNRKVSRNTLSALMIANIFNTLLQFETQGFDGFREEWHAIDLLKNKSVVLRVGEENVNGYALGVDHQGALLVRFDSGEVKRYFSGEVSVRYGV